MSTKNILLTVLAAIVFIGAAILVYLNRDSLASVMPPGTATSTSIRTATIKVTGAPQTVFDWDTDHCSALSNGQPLDAADITDEPAFAYHLPDGSVALLASNHDNLIMRGISLDTVKRTCATLHASDHDSDPSLFTDNQWVSGVEPLFNALGALSGKAIAFVHDEYHGYEHGLQSCIHAKGIRASDYCWYASSTYLTSDDGGATFSEPTPPSNLIISPPSEFTTSVTRLGRSDPVAINNPLDHFIYLFVLKTDGSGAPASRCLLRSPDTDGTHWQMWNGTGFVPVPGSPYQSASGTVPDCTSIPVLQNVWSVKYIPSMKEFVSIGQKGQTVVYSFSNDLVSWSPLQTLMNIPSSFNAWKPGEPAPQYYYSILDPSSTSPDFGTIGTSPYLYFVQWHIEGGVLHNDERDLIRVPLSIAPN